MKKLLTTLMVLLLAGMGCQNQHRKNKLKALERWNSARSQISLELAQGQFNNGELKKAVKTISDILESNPRYVPGHLLLGRIYLEQDRVDKARQCFQQCLQIEPENAAAYYNLGILYERQGHLAQAFEHYQKALNNRPQHLPYLLAGAEVLLSQSRLQEAWDMLSEHLDDTIADARFYLLAGNILTAQNKHKEAVEMFTTAANLSPGDDAITNSLAFALHRLGQAEQALELFQRLDKSAKSQGRELSWSSQLAMGDCYVQLGQYHKAQRCFEYVSNHDTSNPAIWTRLAQTALGRNDPDRACLFAEKALALNPDQADALMVLGYLAHKQGNYEKAEKIFRRLIDNDSQNSLAHCMLGQSLQSRGQEKQAMNCYVRALQCDPTDKLARSLMIAVQNNTNNEY